MNHPITEWVKTSREKLRSGTLAEDDLTHLEGLVTGSIQSVLYLYSKSTSMRAGIAGWVMVDPTRPHEPTLPSQDPPYGSVVEAVKDGWRIIPFPNPTLYSFSDTDNGYLGFEFILEKWL
jgi:hypothetical protein